MYNYTRMASKKLNTLYVLFFLLAIFVFGITVFEDQIRIRIRASSSIVSREKSILLVDKVLAKTPKESVLVTVFARNASGEVLADAVVQVQTTFGTLKPTNATTDTTGKAVFVLTSDVVGKASITATVAGQNLPQRLTVLFSAE